LKFTGSGLVETSGYNAKLQVTSIQAGSLLSLSYVYNATQNNGNLVSQTITRGSSSWTMNYTMPDGTSGYDGMNRLKAANETGGWTESYGYDRWGNRWLSETGLPALNDETPKTSSWYLGNNQITGWTYDGAGNLTKVGSMSRVFSYDAENRQTQAVINGTASSYAYDGDGRRVQAVTPSGTTTYVYDAAGQLAAEYSTVPGTATGRQYVTADALGSTRLLSDGNAQTVVKAFDYLPFGGELLAGTGARTTAMGFNDSTSVQVPDKVSMKFTGKERDAETGLDYFGARYFSAAQGRFTSPDPKQFTDRALEYPQKWNKYAYTQNNPLIFIDPDGKDDIAAAACLDRGSCIQKLAASRGTRGSFVATGALGAAAALFFGGEIAAGARGLWYSVSTYLMTPKGQHTAASVLEGLSDAPPGSLTNDFARLGRTTAESVEKKLSTYLLDMAHPKGGDKAAWFEAALGFTKENMGGLAKQLVFDEGKAFVTQVTEYGTKYNQVINITGTNGKTIAVTVGWIRHPDGVVRLVTAIPSAR
jgi:RHS repeat-associated protein